MRRNILVYEPDDSVTELYQRNLRAIPGFKVSRAMTPGHILPSIYRCLQFSAIIINPIVVNVEFLVDSIVQSAFSGHIILSSKNTSIPRGFLYEKHVRYSVDKVIERSHEPCGRLFYLTNQDLIDNFKLKQAYILNSNIHSKKE